MSRELENCKCEGCAQYEDCYDGKLECLTEDKCNCTSCEDTEKCTELLEEEIKNMTTPEPVLTMALYLNDVVDNESVQQIIEGIRKANNPYEVTFDEVQTLDMSAGYPIRTYEKIILFINSPGGHVSPGMALIHEILASEVPIECRITNAFSMAFLIALACHKRHIYSMGRMMHHDTSYGIMDIHEGVKQHSKIVDKENEILEDFIVSKTNLTKKELVKIRKAKIDRYFFADEALKRGLVDAII